MKFLCSSILALLLVQQGANAFGVRPTSATTKNSASTSRGDFLEWTKAAALAGAGALVFNPEQSVAVDVGGKIRFAGEEIMSPKEHGTSAKPVQSELLYGANNKLADKICNFNRCVPAICVLLCFGFSFGGCRQWNTIRPTASNRTAVLFRLFWVRPLVSCSPV